MSFFSKLFGADKTPQLDNFEWLGTDFHSHLIPGIDDGSKSMEDTLQLIQGLQKVGYKKIITSPHIMTDGYNNSSETIRSGRDNVREALVKHNIDMPFDAIAEYYLDESIFPKIKARDILTTENNYVLVELSYFNKSFNTSKYFFELISAGYKVILAHPERYPYFHSDDLEEYQNIIDTGVSLQINLTSLTGVYGKGAKSMAEKLIDNGMVHFAATDLHNMRHLSYLHKCFESPHLAKLKALPLHQHLL